MAVTSNWLRGLAPQDQGNAVTRSRVDELRRSGRNDSERVGAWAAGSGARLSREEKKRKERGGPRDKARAARAVRWREEKAGEEARGTRPCAGAAAAAWRARRGCVALAPLKEKALVRGPQVSERERERFGKKADSIR